MGVLSVFFLTLFYPANLNFNRDESFFAVIHYFPLIFFQVEINISFMHILH